MSATPGPWEWMFNGTGGQWALVHRLSAYETKYVALGAWPDAPLTPDQLLTAAAPDLLEALQLIVDKLGTDYELYREQQFAIDTARAAIAKATGELA